MSQPIKIYKVNFDADRENPYMTNQYNKKNCYQSTEMNLMTQSTKPKYKRAKFK